MGLTAGLKQEHLKWTHEATLAAADEQKARLAKWNIAMDGYMIDPTKSNNEHFSAVGDHLKSKNYDGVLIGYGIRGEEKFTDLFTGLVNLIVEKGKGSDGKPPKLMFALGPDVMVEAVQGVWPMYQEYASQSAGFIHQT